MRDPVSTRAVAIIVSEPPCSTFRAAPKKRFGRWSALLSIPPDKTLREDAIVELYARARRVIESSKITTSWRCSTRRFAFSRMISGAVREYPIISQVTKFDLGEARVVSLDLDEVARSGGDAANRQTAVMYMLARYVLGRDFYLNDDPFKELGQKINKFT